MAALLVSFVACEEASLPVKVRVDGHRLLRVNISNAAHRSLVEKMELDVWSNEGVVVEGLVDIAAPSYAERLLQRAGIQTEVLIDDIQSVIDEQEKLRTDKSAVAASFFEVCSNGAVSIKQLK